MSHYNYRELRETLELIDLAKRTGESEEVIEDLEKRVEYLRRILGLNLDPKPLKRKRKKTSPEPETPKAQYYDMSPEWNQDSSEDKNQ